MSASTVSCQTASSRTRVCPICEKHLKHLGTHLKNTHKLTTHHERAPYLKRSLAMAKEKEWFHFINLFKNAETLTVDEQHDDATDNADRKTVDEITLAVKRGDTVLEEGRDDTADAERTLAEFHKQTRTISENFQQMEDNLVAMSLKAARMMGIDDDPITMARSRLDVNEPIVKLREIAITALTTLLLSPPAQLKRVSEHGDDNDGARKPKRRKKRASKPASDVRFSGGGLDHLKNGLVRCQLCKFTWDGNAQHDCPYYDVEIKDE